MRSEAAAESENDPAGAVAIMLHISNIMVEYASAASRCTSLVTCERDAWLVGRT
jgi:hypothetical protein